MYHFNIEDYVPRPLPAHSDYVVAAHYYAAWKKGAAGIHGGFEDLHDYPDRTPLMGYYDEENPEVCDWEIKWAAEHGINCFIHCWYRKKENFGKPVTVDDIRCGHGLHEALFHAKYQDFMRFAIMFEASPRWGGTDEKDMLVHLMPFWCEEYFSRSNYLVLDHKPVLFVYQQERLSAEYFPNPQNQRETFDKCREYVRQFGFDGMIFAACVNPLTAENQQDLLLRGYDFTFAYTSGYGPERDFPPEDEIIGGQCRKLRQRLEIDPLRTVATATCFRDATPRTTKHWIDLGYSYHLEKKWHLSPLNFKKMLFSMKKITDSLPNEAWGKRMIMIDNWNEWDEGHFVAPSLAYGFQYLQAIREAFSDCDNLPDYRMPQELGFGGYNQHWRTPDNHEMI